MKAPKKPTNQVRIIGGQFKRRQISFVDAEGLRPTPDRLRETIFNWLMMDIHDAQVLDVCAGSGVLGFEALSRGASHTTFIEPHVAQAAKIKENISTLKLSSQQAAVICQTAQAALPTLTTAYDLIFLDPPYALNLWDELLTLIIRHKLYKGSTLLYIESNQPLTDIIQKFDLQPIKASQVGQITAGIFKIPN